MICAKLHAWWLSQLRRKTLPPSVIAKRRDRTDRMAAPSAILAGRRLITDTGEQAHRGPNFSSSSFRLLLIPYFFLSQCL